MQTSVSFEREVGRAGLIADDRSLTHIHSKLAVGNVKAGLGVFRVPGYGQPKTSRTDPGQVYQLPSIDAAADVDAIVASGLASTTGVQTLTVAGANGVVGATRFYPARRPTITFNSNANWDATTGSMTYYNQNGQLVTETYSIPDGGNATVTLNGYMSQYVGGSIPAQSGTGGTATIGVAVLDGTVNLADFEGVAVFEEIQEANTYLPQDQTYEYPNGATLSVMRKGAIWVETEGTCSAGGDVYVRVGSGSGGSTLGIFRADADTATAVQVTGARFMFDSTGGGLNVVEFF